MRGVQHFISLIDYQDLELVGVKYFEPLFLIENIIEPPDSSNHHCFLGLFEIV